MCTAHAGCLEEAPCTQEDPVEELQTAKRNVAWLLDHATGSVDCHGIAYWAGRVEALRAKVRAL